MPEIVQTCFFPVHFTASTVAFFVLCNLARHSFCFVMWHYNLVILSCDILSITCLQAKKADRLWREVLKSLWKFVTILQENYHSSNYFGYWHVTFKFVIFWLMNNVDFQVLEKNAVKSRSAVYRIYYKGFSHTSLYFIYKEVYVLVCRRLLCETFCSSLCLWHVCEMTRHCQHGGTN